MNIMKFALNEGAEDVVLEKIKGITKQVRFANNSITISQIWNLNFYKLFLTRKNRVMNSTINDTSDDSVKKTIRNLIKISKITQPNKNYFGIAEGPFRYKKIQNTYDKKIQNTDAIDVINSAINSALKHSKRTAGVFYTNTFQREIETSSNILASEKSSSIQISIRAFNESDESGHAVSCSRVLNRFNPDKAGNKAGEIAKLAKKPQKGKKGTYDVIFDPLSISNLLTLIGRFASSFIVDSGYSFLREKIGKIIGNKKVNLIDDGRIENGFNSFLFDEEGVPTKRTVVIDKGILKTYLHNSSTAKKYKAKTTGNAGLISPSPTNIILEKGKISNEDLFHNVRNGLYITNVWYTRFQNYLTGDFSTIPRDGIFLIKNGEIIRSLKGIRISDNLQRMLLNIFDISNKPEWIYWWEVQTPVLTPTILVKNVKITLPTM